jgi:hypothetical protein
MKAILLPPPPNQSANTVIISINLFCLAASKSAPFVMQTEALPILAGSAWGGGGGFYAVIQERGK